METWEIYWQLVYLRALDNKSFSVAFILTFDLFSKNRKIILGNSTAFKSFVASLAKMASLH